MTQPLCFEAVTQSSCWVEFELYSGLDHNLLAKSLDNVTTMLTTI